MKKLIALLSCTTLLLGGGYSKTVFANEVSEISNVENETQEQLSNFNSDNIKIRNHYIEFLEFVGETRNDYSFYNAYKDYIILYQQYTGINTLNYTDIEIIIENQSIGSIRIDKETTTTTGYTISSKIKSNPAEENKDYINTPQNFNIIVEINVTDPNGKNMSTDISIPARVVKVEGKVISRPARKIISESLRYEDIKKYGGPLGYAQSLNTNIVVELLDGTIKSDKGLPGQGGSVGGLTTVGGVGGPFDLKYIYEGAEDAFSVDVSLHNVYTIDKQGNIVDPNGNVLISNDKREIRQYTSNNHNVTLSAKQGTFHDNATLSVKEVNNLSLSQPYIAYDLNVISEDQVIQPVGTATISLIIPESLKNKQLSIYYINENGEYEKVNSEIKDNKVYFETTHFSTYVLTETISEPSDENNVESSEPSTPATEGDNNSLDDSNVVTDKIESSPNSSQEQKPSSDNISNNENTSEIISNSENSNNLNKHNNDNPQTGLSDFTTLYGLAFITSICIFACLFVKKRINSK